VAGGSGQLGGPEGRHRANDEAQRPEQQGEAEGLGGDGHGPGGAQCTTEKRHFENDNSLYHKMLCLSSGKSKLFMLN